MAARVQTIGGAAAWSPRVMPPVPDLTPRQQLACAFRILARTGFSENIAGHITWDPNGTGELWVNPWGKWWEELTASDICRVSADGDVLEGPWDVTPAIHIHTELHRRRPDARVVVHNHPYFVTLLACLGVLPEILHQTGCMYDGDMAFVDEYTGEVSTAELGADLAERIGDRSVVVLANHGLIVTAPSIEEAVYRSASFDRQCRLMYDAMVVGGNPQQVSPRVRGAMKASLLERGAEVYWAGAVRMLVESEPEVLA